MKQAGFTYISSVSDMVTADFVPDGEDKGGDELTGLGQQQRDPEGCQRFIPAETAAAGPRARLSEEKLLA